MIFISYVPCYSSSPKLSSCLATSALKLSMWQFAKICPDCPTRAERLYLLEPSRLNTLDLLMAFWASCIRQIKQNIPPPSTYASHQSRVVRQNPTSRLVNQLCWNLQKNVRQFSALLVYLNMDTNRNAPSLILRIWAWSHTGRTYSMFSRFVRSGLNSH